MTEVRIFKRYQNRKLYDTQESRYVTGQQLLEIYARSPESLVIIHGSGPKKGEDITAAVLASVVAHHVQTDPVKAKLMVDTFVASL